MKTINTINRIAFATILTFIFSTVTAQTDTMYIMKAGVVINKQSIMPTDVDSIIFYKPTSTSVNPFNLQMVTIPAGTFDMGSPTTEPWRSTNESQFSVTLSAFKMSKYEITNAEYAAFLNAKSIGSNGLYAAGAYPLDALINQNIAWGLTYTVNKWVPVAGYENHPVISVTWYGAKEFATYVGGTLPTEAQWEYASRGGTTTPFNTGNCISNLQSNFNWALPYYGSCTLTATTSQSKTQAVGAYAANAYGLHDMHGNVWEWCADWFDTYPTTAQIDPTGPSIGSYRMARGGSWNYSPQYIRSAHRAYYDPRSRNPDLGFRVVLVP